MKEIWPQLRERWKGALKRYQYVLLVMAAGVLLMTSCKVTVTYFVQDELKEGGHYERYSGYVRTIDDYDRILIMHGGKNIKIADIIDIIADIYSDVL